MLRGRRTSSTAGKIREKRLRERLRTSDNYYSKKMASSYLGSGSKTANVEPKRNKSLTYKKFKSKEELLKEANGLKCLAF